MKSIVRLSVFLLLATATASPFQSKEKAPNFSLKMSNGKSLSLSKFKGKVVLLNFWATWCGPCIAEIPGFLEVYEKHKARGFEIVGISLDETGWEDITPFVKKHKIIYPVVLGNQKVSKAYGEIYGLPTSFVIDKKGYIVNKHVGLMTREMLENKIKDLL